MRIALLGTMVALMFAGCSSGSGGTTSGSGTETLENCDPVCVGGEIMRYVRTCSEDAKDYVYEDCETWICVNGACESPQCYQPGHKECDPYKPGFYLECDTTLTKLSPGNCPDDTQCIEGACAVKPCEAGKKECGWGAILECAEDGSGWVAASTCNEDQFCDPEAVACQDMDPMCLDHPQGTTCQNLDTALQCDLRGEAAPVKCGGSEVCVEGFCQPKVDGVEYELAAQDLSGQDDSGSTLDDIFTMPEIQETLMLDLPPKDIPPLEKPPKAWATFNGGDFINEEIKFTSSKAANYLHKDVDLQVTMAKGVYMLELHLGGIEQGVVGSFSSDEPGSVNPWVWFNDGTHDQTGVQWKYQSVSYAITLDQFDPVGGRAIGTFSCVLEDQTGGDSIEVTDGFFDVPRKQ